VVEARTATKPRSRFSICRAGVAAGAVANVASADGVLPAMTLSSRRASNCSIRGRLRDGRMPEVLLLLRLFNQIRGIIVQQEGRRVFGVPALCRFL
jgi:hypothetical protein